MMAAVGTQFHVETFVHEPYQVNTYLVWDEESKAAFMIDIGGQIAPLVERIQSKDLQFEDVFHTHAFLEYLEGQPPLRDEFDILAHMNPLDEFWLAHLDTQATILTTDTPQAYVDQQVWPGDTVKVGPFEVVPLETPGVTPGSLSFYVPQLKAVFVGDLLYKGQVGPTDIPHANLERLKTSIQSEIFSLPDDTVIYPGRGESTTVAEEKANNTFESRPYAYKK